MKNRLLGAASLCLALVAAPAFAQTPCDCPCPECPETHAEHHKETATQAPPVLSAEEQAAVTARKRAAAASQESGTASTIAGQAVAAAMKAVGAALNQVGQAAQSASSANAEPAA